ncbi:Piso0_003889 [Millerozyma farinosa CBS 7064]|uniref:Piso0_003889 protein n=1 Tax=Pichia sorbitophila (strain ATCC MYA-4447 / BCRC 22081 / CBS 7064 / NBRC 10061 / NRRL Y-12695) TaxID=559304 RepID=G8Y6W5_PICSO|nr:Piso0_003889 [Millerozyma farinosa CBS 7064]CCE84345.1 Piso0_003889 [Millerozyma farinosa CBS 7064]
MQGETSRADDFAPSSKSYTSATVHSKEYGLSSDISFQSAKESEHRLSTDVSVQRTTHEIKKTSGPLVRLIHSFKRSEDTDPETGEISLGNDLSGFSLQMIALGASVGTGLLVGTGSSLAESGVLPLLLGFMVIASFIYCMTQALAELAVALPVPGSFTLYACMFVDKSWGFAVGWNYCLQWLILLPMELAAAAMTMHYWPQVASKVSDAQIITYFYLTIIAMNLFSVKYYGYFEAGFSILKLVFIMLFLALGFLLAVGLIGDSPVGFRYWKSPGVVSKTYVDGFIGVIITAAFSYTGSEMVGISASESKHPEKDVPDSIKKVFWRVSMLYLVSLFLLGLLVPYNSPELVGNSSAGANASPFVIALSGIKVSAIADIMNVAILVSIFSVGNSSIYASSRTLVALAEIEQAPSFLKYIDKKKRPLIASICAVSTGSLAYISILSPSGAETLFLWLMALSGISVISTYATIMLSHIRFRKVLALNDISLVEELPYITPLGTAGSWYGIAVAMLVFCLQVFVSCKASIQHTDYFKIYQDISGFLVINLFYVGHKIFTYVKHNEFEYMVDCKNVNIKIGRFANESSRRKNKLDIVQNKTQCGRKPWYISIRDYIRDNLGSKANF